MNRRNGSVAQQLESLSGDKQELLKLLREQHSRKARTLKSHSRQFRDGSVQFPASLGQQRMWFIDQLEEGRAGYQLLVPIRLQGGLDPRVLQTALDAVVERHEVLRTVFIDIEGDPVQHIAATAEICLGFCDLSQAGQHEREAFVRAAKIEEVQTRFDLAKGPLIRARLIRIQPTEHLLLITLHHILCDGWSKGVLIRELSEFYSAGLEGRLADLPPLPIQYADYALWQRQQWQDSEIARKKLDYWRTELADAAPYLELPTDRPRPQVQSYRGENVPIVIEAGLCAQLRALAQQHDVTLFMVLQAALAILLSRLSGQADVLVGTQLANRERPEVEGLIGFFVNTIVLRVGVTETLPLREFLQRVKKAMLGAYDHQDVPLEKIVEAVQPQRSLSRNPLFQVVFVLHNEPRSELRAPGLSGVVETDVDEPAILDLWLSLEECGDVITGSLNYAQDLFDRATVVRWLACYQALLGRMTQDPTGAIGNLPIIAGDELTRVTETFNAPLVSFPQSGLLHHFFEEQARRRPLAVAVTQDARELTYEALNNRANQLARCLRAQGVGPGQLVGLCVERSLEMIVGLVAILKAGGAYVPLDPGYPSLRLEYIVRDAAPRIVLIQEHLRSKVPVMAAQIIALDADWDAIEEFSTSDLDAAPDELVPSQLAYVIYTSGSTGKPKGVMVEHANVTRLFAATTDDFAFDESDVWTLFHSFAFDFSVWEIWGALLHGGRLVIVSLETSRSPNDFYSLLCEQQVTVLNQTPSSFSQLIEAQGQAIEQPHALRFVIFGGEALDLRMLQPWVKRNGTDSPRLVNMYGITETTVHVTFCLLTEEQIASEHANVIGRPLQDLQVYLLDSYQHPVPIGVTGEIYVGGAGVARAYLNRPDLTSQRFLANPYDSRAHSRLYRSGDLAKWRAEGTLVYLGRNDAQVKIRGFRIELGEIEAHLTQHPDVKEAVVLAREAASGDQHLVAFWVCADTHSAIYPSVDDLRNYLKGSIPDYMVPGAFVRLQQMPLTSNGKLDRGALPSPAADSYVTRPFAAPSGLIEETLAQIWTELLGERRIGRFDNLFELGGHSLHVMKLVGKIAERLQVRVSAAAVFLYPTIHEMAGDIQRLRRARPRVASLSEGSPGGILSKPSWRDSPLNHDFSLSFAQQAHWNLYRLSERKSIRQVASAMRLQGRLNLKALRQGLENVVRRHDALRTRIQVIDGVPVQRIMNSPDFDFEVLDLTGSQEGEAMDSIVEFIRRPVDLTADPLFGVRLLQLRPDQHVLIIAMEHIISDGFSLNVLARDIAEAYIRAVRGESYSAPAIQMQFAEYARRQRDSVAAWLADHGEYWRNHLAGCQRLRLPSDRGPDSAPQPGRETVPIWIDREATADLRTWCKQMKTTAPLCLFAVYVALVLRWCETRSGVLLYYFDGRVSPESAQTVGCFAGALYLRIELLEADTFVELLERVTRVWVTAYERADFSYLAAQTPAPEFSRNPGFNWLPQGSLSLDLSALAGSDDALAWSPMRFEYPAPLDMLVDREPFFLLSEADQAIRGDVYYPRDRFSSELMQRFGMNFGLLLNALLHAPGKRIHDISLNTALQEQGR